MTGLEKIWEGYHAGLELPTGSQWLLRKIGVLLYAILLLGGIAIFSYKMYAEAGSRVEEYKITAGDYSYGTPHRLPDVLVCPSRLKNWPAKYNVWYQHTLLKSIGMSLAVADELADTYFKSCPSSQRCPGLKGGCEGKWRGYCDKIEQILEQHRITQFSRRDLPIPQKHAEYLSAWKDQEKMSLDLLWLSITGWYYGRSFQHYLRGVNLTRLHTPVSMAIYRQPKGNPLGQQFFRGIEEVWLGNNLCNAVRSSMIDTSVTPYFGLSMKIQPFKSSHLFTFENNSVPYRFWIGNFDTMEVTESSLITRRNHMINKLRDEFFIQPRASCIVYYSMIHLVQPDKARTCIKQPMIRGLPAPCVDTNSNDGGVWYYEVSYNTEREIGHTVWVYPNSKEKIITRNSFTLYTQFQLAVGILGTCVGLSFFQIVEVTLSFFKNSKWVRPSKYMIYVIISCVTISLTIYDSYGYIKTRVSTELSMSPTNEFPMPRLSLCQSKVHPYSFWNFSKFHEHQISLELSIFIKMHIWQRNRGKPVFFGFTNRADSSERNYTVPEWTLNNIDLGNFNYTRNNGTVVIRCPLKADCNKPVIPKVKRARPLDSLYNPTAKYFYDTNPHHTVAPKFGLEFVSEEYEKFSKSIIDELNVLGEKIGVGSKNLALVDFTTPFALNPADFISCKSDPSCGNFLDYRMIQEPREVDIHEKFCLILEPKPGFPKIEGVGREKGVEIIFDSEKYLHQSDLNDYYGPHTELEQKQNWPDSACLDKSFFPNKESRFAGKTECGIGGFSSFELKLTHPKGGSSESTVQLDNFGLTGKNGFAISLNPTFKNQLAWASDCITKPVCKFPRDEIHAVTAAIQMEIYCGCTYCINKNSKFMEHMEKILQRTRHCCTAQQFLSCYGQYAATVKEKEGYYDFRAGSGRILHQMTRKFPDNLDAYKKINDSDSFDRLFINGDKVENATKSRVLQFFADCTAPTCEQNGLEIGFVQSEPTTGKNDVLILFYESNIAKGTNQVDRLDPAQFLGVFSCTYSFTVGISLVGLVHVIVCKLLRHFRNTNSESDNTFVNHVIRSLGVMISPGTKVSAENKTGRSGMASQVKIFSHVLEERRIPEVSERSSQKKDHQSIQADNVREIQDMVVPKHEIITDCCLDDEKNNDQLSVEAACTDYKGTSTSNTGINTGASVSSNRHLPKPKMETLEACENSRPNSGATDRDELITIKAAGKPMFFVLCCAISTLVLILFYFFLTAQQLESGLEVETRPTINIPSLALCTNLTKKKMFEEVLKNSECDNESNPKKTCFQLFSVRFWRTDEICALIDNSRNFKTLAGLENVLEIVAPQGFEMRLWVSGLNDTDLSEKSPSFTWRDRDLFLTYSVTMTEDRLGRCTNNYPHKECPRCDTTRKSGFCCTHGNKGPGMILKNSCTVYNFNVEVDNKSPSTSSHRRLRLGPTNEVMRVTINSYKLSAIDYFSMTGGFVGALVEVTLINVVCALVWGIARVYRRLIA